MRFAVLPGSTPAGQGPILRDSLALSDVNGVAEMGVRATALGDRGVVRASLVAQRDQAVDLIVRGTTRSTVASVQPANPGGGDTLIIRGFGLGTVASAVSVAIGGQQAALLGVAADTLVRAIVPACLPNGATSVTVRNGTRQTDPTPVTIANRGSVLALATLQPQVVTDTALGRGCIALPADGGRYLLVPHFASAIDGGPPTPPPPRCRATVSPPAQRCRWRRVARVPRPSRRRRRCSRCRHPPIRLGHSTCGFASGSATSPVA